MTMRGRGARTRIATGIYRDRYGLEASVKIGSGTHAQQRAKRFPHTTELKTIQRWQAHARAELLTIYPRRRRRTHQTIEAALPAFLATVTGRTKLDYEILLRHWIDSPIGALERHTITRLHVRTQLATWRAAGVAASTINKRLNALRRFCAVLDEDDEHTSDPTRGIAYFDQAEPEPREIPRPLIDAILKKLPDRGQGLRHQKRSQVSKTKARLRVIAETGLPHTQLMKMRPDHIDWITPALYVTPRRKGKGTKACTLPLTRYAVDALQAFAAADAWGIFSRHSLYKSWHRAIAALERELTTQAVQDGHPPITLPRWRPYDLRHSFGTQLLRASKNQRAVQSALLHADIRTTDRYTVNAINENVQAALIAYQRIREVPAATSRHKPSPAKPRQKQPTRKRLLTGTFGRKSS